MVDKKYCVTKDKKAYVGEYAFVPHNIQPLDDTFARICPSRFHDYLGRLPEKAYYNNLYWLDFFPAEQIVVCSDQECILLWDHPEYVDTFDIYLNGEIVSFVLGVGNREMYDAGA